MSSTIGVEFAFVPVNSISYTSEDVVAGCGKKIRSMPRGNEILHKLCCYLEVSPSLLEPLFAILSFLCFAI